MCQRLTTAKIDEDLKYIRDADAPDILRQFDMISKRQQGIIAISVVFCILFLNACTSANDNWSRFRGDNGAGVSDSLVLPTDLSRYAWNVDLPGSGTSSPVIWGEKLIVTSCVSESAQLHVQCLNIVDGKEFWKTSFDSTPYRLHGRNSFAASTPAIDKEHIYITFASADHTFLVALDHAGKEVWRRDFGRWVSMHGFGMSPIVYRNKVIFSNSQQGVRVRRGSEPGKSRMTAVDSLTGKTVWESDLKTTLACYAVPCVYSADSQDQLICCSNAEGFYSLNPESGELNWSKSAFEMRTVASPVLAGDLVLGSNGSGGGGNYLVAMRIGAKEPKEVYRVRQSANYVPTPVVVNGLAFLFSDKGIATCINVETGKEYWRERVARGFSGSPVANGENIYVIDEAGNAIVIAAAAEFSLIGTHSLGESCRATPAIAGNRIFLRTESKLFCIEASKN